MPNFERAPKKQRNGGPPEREKPAMIIEPRCQVCQSEHRPVIDRMLALNTPYQHIETMFSTEEHKIERRSVSNHDKKHLNYESAAVRELISREAKNAQENLNEGISSALQRRIVLDIAIQKVLERLADDSMEIEFRDIAKVVELREKIDVQTDGAAIEELHRQFAAFKRAVEEETDGGQRRKIVTRTKEILLAESQRPALQPPPK